MMIFRIRHLHFMKFSYFCKAELKEEIVFPLKMI